MWRNEPAEVKARFQKLAEEEKSKHALQYPEYKCSPRKSSKIKKRKRGCKKTLISIEAAMSAGKCASWLPEENVQDTEMPFKKHQTNSQLHRSDSIGVAAAQEADMQFFADIDENDPAFMALVADIDKNDRAFRARIQEVEEAIQANYVAAQEQDTQFFGEIDSSEEGYQALAAEVREAFEAGYYDDALIAGYTTLNDAVDATLLSDKDYRLGQYGI